MIAFPLNTNFFFRHRNRILALLLLVLSSISLVPLALAEPAVVVVVNEHTQLQSIKRAYLRSIFGMRARTLPNGDAVRVFVLRDNHPVHKKFTKSILKTFPYNLRKIWDSRVFSGTGSSPTAVASEQEMYEMVSTTDNAIGYLTEDFMGPGVRILELQEL